MFGSPNIAGNDLLILFVIILIGILVGQREIFKTSLGSAGVFLVAAVFGHYGFRIPFVRELGLVLFVCFVGYVSGPGFLKSLKEDGWRLAIIALAMVGTGIVATIILAYLLHLPPNLAAGMFAGALTNTPALATATDVAEKHLAGSGLDVAAGYGIVYVPAIIIMVLYVTILPQIFRRDPEKEEQEWWDSHKDLCHELLVENFSITNPNVIGRSLEKLEIHKFGLINMTRIRRGEIEILATPEFCLAANDIVTVVGEPSAFENLPVLLGPKTQIELRNDSIISLDTRVLSSKIAGRTVGELDIWRTHKLVVTRIIREKTEIAPKGSVTVEREDILRIVGEKRDALAFSEMVSAVDEHSYDMDMRSFCLILIVGLFLGAIPVLLPNGTSLMLGSAGGVLVSSIAFSHWKHIGSWDLGFSAGALNLLEKMGIYFFLAGAGLAAGSKFVAVFQQYGVSVLLAGAGITLSSLIAGTVVMLILKMDIMSMMGSLAGGCTQPAALAVAKRKAKTGLPMIANTGVYAPAMLMKAIFIQLLLYVLWAIIA